MTERNNTRRSLTNLVGDLVDDAKDLFDDALDRASDTEHSARRSAAEILGGTKTEDELDALRRNLDELTAKVDRLVAHRGESDRE